MRCYLGFLLCVLALTATAFVPEDQPHTYQPVGKCPPKNGPMPVYLPDDKNQTIFYECNHGIPIKLECPAGLIFRPNPPGCVYPTVVPKPYKPVGQCPERDGADPVYLPDDEDLTIFYECSNGIPVRMECPEGLIFSPVARVCVRP